jgi:hypothetical protein
MGGDGGRDAFAAGQSGADELVGVGAVDLGAGQAPGRAAGLARDGQDAAGFVDGGVAVEDFAGAAVDVVDPAAEQDGLGAAACVVVLVSGCGGGVGSSCRLWWVVSIGVSVGVGGDVVGVGHVGAVGGLAAS